MYDIFVFENDIPTIIFSCDNFKLEEDLVTFYKADGSVMTEMNYLKLQNKGENSYWFWI